MVTCIERGADCLHMVQLMPVHPKTPPSLASFKSRLVLPFWCWLTQVVLEKRLLSGCSVIVAVIANNENANVTQVVLENRPLNGCNSSSYISH